MDDDEETEDTVARRRKKELEEIKLANLLKRAHGDHSDSPFAEAGGIRGKSTSRLSGLSTLWRVDLLALINKQEAEKAKSKAGEIDEKKKERLRKLKKLAKTLDDD